MRDDILMSARHPLEYARRYPIHFGPGLESEAIVALTDKQEQVLRKNVAQNENDTGWMLGLATIVSLLLWAILASVGKWAFTTIALFWSLT